MTYTTQNESNESIFSHRNRFGRYVFESLSQKFETSLRQLTNNITMTTTAAALTDITNTDDYITEDLPQSPRAMVDAVMAEAVAERARLTQPTQDENTNPACGPTVHVDSDASLKALMDATNDDDKYEVATKVVIDQIELLMQQGLKAFHAHESTTRDLSLAKEELESKDRELQRLRSSEESSRKTITVSLAYNNIGIMLVTMLKRAHNPSSTRTFFAPSKPPKETRATLPAMLRWKPGSVPILQTFVRNVMRPWVLCRP